MLKLNTKPTTAYDRQRLTAINRAALQNSLNVSFLCANGHRQPGESGLGIVTMMQLRSKLPWFVGYTGLCDGRSEYEKGDRMTVSIEAEIGVRRLHALCSDAVWRRDGAAFGACYAEDGVWKIAGLEFCGRRAIARALHDLGAGNTRVLMQFGSPILELVDGTLIGRTYAVEQVKLLDGSASATIGIYYERFVEKGGRWLFQRRHFDFCYLGSPDLSDRFYAFNDYGEPPGMPSDDAPTAGLCVQDEQVAGGAT